MQLFLLEKKKRVKPSDIVGKSMNYVNDKETNVLHLNILQKIISTKKYNAVNNMLRFEVNFARWLIFIYLCRLNTYNDILQVATFCM